MMHLFLIGYRGAGKSTVAEYLAEALGREWWRSDEVVQRDAAMSIAEIFESGGEADFRDRESAAIQKCIAQPPAIVDLGGGAVLRESNRSLIQNAGKVVWLTASAEVHWERISKDGRSSAERPRLTPSDGLAEVRQMLAQRQSVYAECADWQIDTSELAPREVAERITAWWATVDKKD